MSEKED